MWAEGLGLWVWYWHENYVELARRLRADYLLVKQADGVDRWDQWPKAKAACAKAGLAVYPWSYNYGDADEAAHLEAITAGGVYVLDPEIEFERLAQDQQRAFVDRVLRAKRAHGLELGCACWARPDVHAASYYQALARVVDLWLPMVAWQEWTPREPAHWFDAWDRAMASDEGWVMRDEESIGGLRSSSRITHPSSLSLPTVPWVSAQGVSPRELADAVALAMTRYGGCTIWAAHVLSEGQVSELEKRVQRADPDFARYAPKTGTWREACINLKGIADDALAAGRKIVADAAATWGTR